MLDVPAELAALLTNPKPGVVVSQPRGQALYQGRTQALNLAHDGDITWDADGDIQASGNIHVVGFGEPVLVPRQRDDLLAPYGQEVALSREVITRDKSFLIPLGIYRITGNDGGRYTTRAGTDVVLDWEVDAKLTDRFRMLQRAKLVNPASPPAGATVYSELQRLGLFPIVQSADVPDAAVPAGMVYDSRLDAVHALASIAGARPRINRQGALTLVPADRWLTETTAEFDIPGTITWTDDQTDDFYNLVWAHSDDNAFSAFATLDDAADPRSVGRAGPSTYEHSSPAYDSESAVQAGADTVLSRLVNRRSKTVTVEVGPIGLLLELSDFGWVRDPLQGRAVLGEITSLTISHDPTDPITLTLTVAEEA